jgi:hypothetical protein
MPARNINHCVRLHHARRIRSSLFSPSLSLKPICLHITLPAHIILLHSNLFALLFLLLQAVPHPLYPNSMFVNQPPTQICSIQRHRQRGTTEQDLMSIWPIILIGAIALHKPIVDSTQDRYIVQAGLEFPCQGLSTKPSNKEETHMRERGLDNGLQSL